ncbi:hypothetical protein FOL47_009192 [Perkinsus chesapeaki]|uniref:LRAT domain-containing protein n=1 Tax=Perkinsus chesapeaki TaxID=330153 RepID=A0A7J6LA14_PERCH|nr:hypothetical protein FOL47_009192 [Perkinsus chesapeaki]
MVLLPPAATEVYEPLLRPRERWSMRCRRRQKALWSSSVFRTTILAIFIAGPLTMLMWVNDGGSAAAIPRPKVCSSNSAQMFGLQSMASEDGIQYSQHLTYDIGGCCGHVILREPKLCDSTVQQYSGYFTVDPMLNKKYFFWFFESRQPGKKKSPTTLWLSGGPGSSSMLALLMENGPCNIQPNATTVPNPFSWTEASNMLWVDQPAGTGFSTGAYDRDEDEVSEDMYKFLQAFFKRFPEYNKEFYITGESFGGQYVPSLAARIVRKNGQIKTEGTNSERVVIDFRGMAIGNGITVPEVQMQWFPQMAYNSTTAPSVISKETYEGMEKALPQLKRDFEACTETPKEARRSWFSLPDVCVRAWVTYAFTLIMPIMDAGYNKYDLRKKGNYDFSPLEKYLNKPTVMKGLGALRPWRPDSLGVAFHLRPTEFSRSHASDVELVLSRGARVLIYAGDQDYLCNWLGNQAWTNSLQWEHQANFSAVTPAPWGKLNDSGAVVFPVGALQQYENFAFLRVYNAGHMAPMDRPAETLYMFQKFVEGDIFVFGQSCSCMAYPPVVFQSSGRAVAIRSQIRLAIRIRKNITLYADVAIPKLGPHAASIACVCRRTCEVAPLAILMDESSTTSNAAAATAALAAASFLWGVATKSMSNSVSKADLKTYRASQVAEQYQYRDRYSHHGIVVDVNPCPNESCDHRGVCCTVVHFAGHQASDSAIKMTSLGTFAGEQGTTSVKRFKYGCTNEQVQSERAGTCSLKVPDPVWMVALRALSMVNNSEVEYNLLEKNCELFCCWCELGTRSGIVNFASDEKRAIGQSDPERFRGLSAVTSSVAQSLGFRDAHVAAATAAVNSVTQSAFQNSDKVTAFASAFLHTPSTKKDSNLQLYSAVVAKVFAFVPVTVPPPLEDVLSSEDISASISVVKAIVANISQNARLLRNADYITSPLSLAEWEAALKSALCDVARAASRK